MHEADVRSKTILILHDYFWALQLITQDLFFFSVEYVWEDLNTTSFGFAFLKMSLGVQARKRYFHGYATVLTDSLLR